MSVVWQNKSLWFAYAAFIWVSWLVGRKSLSLRFHQWESFMAKGLRNMFLFGHLLPSDSRTMEVEIPILVDSFELSFKNGLLSKISNDLQLKLIAPASLIPKHFVYISLIMSIIIVTTIAAIICYYHHCYCHCYFHLSLLSSSLLFILEYSPRWGVVMVKGTQDQ